MEVVDIHKKYLNESGYKDLKEWLSYPNNIYIGRNMSFYVPGANKSKWSNPFSVKKYGLEQSLILYEQYIKSSSLYDQLDELENKILGCWCIKTHKECLNEICHGQVLIRLLNQK